MLENFEKKTKNFRHSTTLKREIQKLTELTSITSINEEIANERNQEKV